jgi:hypothetical protein
MPRKHYFILFLVTHSSFAQNALSHIGARGWGMANALVAVSHSQSYFTNPAGLAFQRGTQVNTSFDSRFELAGLNTAACNFVHGTDMFSFAIGAEKFGDRLYSESKVGIALAKATDRVSLGIKTSYLGSLANNYSSTGTLYTEFGILARLNKAINVGFTAQNLTGAKWYKAEPLPTILTLGSAVSPVSQLIWTLETTYIPGQQFTFRSGIEYALRERLLLRTGINSFQKSNHFGVGYLMGKWAFDYAVNTHPNLGLSHHVSLNLHLKPKS